MRLAKDNPVNIAIVDGYNVAYRNFSVLQERGNFTSRQGVPTSAVHGFLNSVQKFLKETQAQSVVVAMEGKSNFRYTLHPKYKEGRTMPDTFRQQIPLIKQLTTLQGWHLLEQEGFEADDIIAAVHQKARSMGKSVAIFTNDKDLATLLDGQSFIYKVEGGKGMLLDTDDYAAKWGVPVTLIPELLMLMGDSVDKIPGVPGIGEKTAVKLLKLYGSVEGIYQHLDALTEKHRALFTENRASVELARQLVGLRPQGVQIGDQVWKNYQPNIEALLLFYRELDMKRAEEQCQRLINEKSNNLFTYAANTQNPEKLEVLS